MGYRRRRGFVGFAARVAACTEGLPPLASVAPYLAKGGFSYWRKRKMATDRARLHRPKILRPRFFITSANLFYR